MNVRYFLRLACAGVVVGAACTAQGKEYDIKHEYDLQLRNNEVFRGEWRWRADAYARSRSQGVVDPPANAGARAFTPPDGDTKTVIAVSGAARGEGNASFTAAAGGTGSHRVWGSAVATPDDGLRASGNSGSTIAVNTGTVDAGGRIRWKPWWRFDSIAGGKSDGRDPIHFILYDRTTEEKLLEETLFDLDLKLRDQGTATWDEGLVSIMSTGSGSFSVAMDSPHMTTPGGSLLLTWADGTIVSSIDTGVFDGLLPPVGGPANWSGHLGDSQGAFDIGFDFGDGNFDLTAELGASGAAEVPEPGALGLFALAIVPCLRRWR